MTGLEKSSGLDICGGGLIRQLSKHKCVRNHPRRRCGRFEQKHERHGVAVDGFGSMGGR